VRNSADSDFERDFAAIVDVDYMMRTLAVDALSGQWDGIYDGNNMLLYFDGQRFKFARYDLDNSFGSIGFWAFAPLNRTLRTGSLLSFGAHGPNRALLSRALGVDSFARVYMRHCRALLERYLSVEPSSPFWQRVLAMHATIDEAATRDQWHELDAMFSRYEFASNVGSASIERTFALPVRNLSKRMLIVEAMQSWAHARIASAKQEIDQYFASSSSFI
jgi:CotH kinase protein